MNQIISEMIKSDCSHRSRIITNGSMVCKDCGLELEKVYKNSYCVDGNPKSDKVTRNSRYSGSFESNSFIDLVGSFIPVNFNKIKNVNKFKRLSKQNKYFQGKYNYDNRASLIILNRVGGYLQPPGYIIEGTALRFRKISNSEIDIINRVSCLCFCLWDTIRQFKYKTCLKEVLEAFNNTGHKISKRLIIRDGSLYREILAKKGIAKTVSKSIGDYISRHIGILRSNIELIKKRLMLKSFNINSEVYLTEIEILCYKIIEKIRKYLSYKSINPYNASASCIYFASRLISEKYQKKTIITQNDLAELTKVPVYEMRMIFINIFKPLLSKIKLRGD